MDTVTNNLTTLDKTLLEVMQGTEYWLSRSMIANLIGRGTLTVYQIERLEHLVKLGLVDKETRRRGVAQIYYEYKPRGDA